MARVGLLWYESSGELKTEKAIKAYQRRFNNMPNVVYCRDVFECDELEVRQSSRVLPKHYFLVKEVNGADRKRQK